MFDLKKFIKNCKGGIITNNPKEILNCFLNENPLSDLQLEHRKTQKILLEKGIEWIFGFSKLYQPNFYNALLKKNCKLYYVAHPIDDPFSDKYIYYDALCIIGDNVCFSIGDSPLNLEINEVTIFSDFIWDKLYCSVPKELVLSYFLRIQYMHYVKDEFYKTMSPKRFPIIASSSVIDMVRNPHQKKKVRNILNNHREPANKGENTEFLVFLDTLDEKNPIYERDILIFERFGASKKIYLVPKMDFDKIKLLAKPIEAIDHYMSSLILHDEVVSFEEFC